jgi:hypothetical protein
MTGRHGPEDYSDRSDRDLLVIAVTQLEQLLALGEDHEERLRTLERRVPSLAAIATAAGSLLGGTGGTIIHALTGGH